MMLNMWVIPVGLLIVGSIVLIAIVATRGPAAGGRAVGRTVLFIVGFVLTAGLLIPILAVFGQSKDLQAHGVRR